MKVLVACEFSGIVRDAFRARGHDAWSCDLLPTEREGPHIQDDVLKHLDDGWDLMISHPPCTYLSRTSEQWLKKQGGRWDKMVESAGFFKSLLNAKIPKIAVENPRPHQHALKIIEVRFTQVVNPNQFGDAATKATCLWLRGLPALMDTITVRPDMVRSKRSGRQWGKWFWDSSMLKGEERAKFRSRTFRGLANAMAEQWG